jgi:hypothetical protein
VADTLAVLGCVYRGLKSDILAKSFLHRALAIKIKRFGADDERLRFLKDRKISAV